MRQGYRLDFDGEILPRLSRKVRHTVIKAERELYVRAGSLGELRRVHFDPVYLPRKLKKNQRVYVAVLDDTLPPISAVLVEDLTDHIYYKYSGNNPAYKSYQGNSYLLWWVAASYQLKGYKYFDLGGSKKPKIERFKRSFSTSRYPIKEKGFLLVLYKKIVYHIKKRYENGF